MSLLVFVHVPKAAGTTLQRVIDRQYAPQRVVSFADPDEAERVLAATPPETLDEVEAVQGHVYYGIHHHFRQRPQYVTVLRHPVSRIVSHYRYVRATPEHYLHAAVVEGGVDLGAYARGDLSGELRNGQVQMFSARARELDECDDACLEEAKRVLAEEFEVVGLTERFDESLLLMQDAFGWSTPYHSPENRGSTSRTAIMPETAEAIEEANGYDLALYEFAAGLFEERLSADPGVATRLARFRRRNRVLGPAQRLLRLPGALARRLG